MNFLLELLPGEETTTVHSPMIQQLYNVLAIFKLSFQQPLNRVGLLPHQVVCHGLVSLCKVEVLA